MLHQLLEDLFESETSAKASVTLEKQRVLWAHVPGDVVADVISIVGSPMGDA